MLKDLEKEFNVKFDDYEQITQVQFSFSPEIWVDLINMEGELLGQCCSSISFIRDEFIDALRNDGWMSVNGMRIIFQNQINHEWDKDHPITKVVEIYEKISDFVKFDKPTSFGTDVESMLRIGAFSQIMEYCSEFGLNYCASYKKSLNGQATQNILMFNIYPVIKSLYEDLKTKAYGPVEGYALVRVANMEIYKLSNSLAILPSLKEAKVIMEDWIKHGLKEKDICIKAVRVSIDKGIEFIDKINKKFVLPKPKIEQKQYRFLWKSINKLRDDNDNDYVEVILLDTLNKLKELNN